MVEYLEAPAFFLVPMYDPFNAVGTVDPSVVQPNTSNNCQLTFGGGHMRNGGRHGPRSHGCNAVAEAPDAARVGQPSPIQWTVQWVVRTEHHEP